jgi:hypothetical protein
MARNYIENLREETKKGMREKAERELLPTRYLHVVFTLPSRLAPLVLQNKKVIYDPLFRSSAETLLEVARNPEYLGADSRHCHRDSPAGSCWESSDADAALLRIFPRRTAVRDPNDAPNRA